MNHYISQFAHQYILNDPIMDKFCNALQSTMQILPGNNNILTFITYQVRVQSLH